MRTSIELPDALFRSVKTLAVSRGVTFKALVTESLQRTLEGAETPEGVPSWKRHLGALDATAADEVGRRLAEIDEEAWRVQSLSPERRP